MSILGPFERLVRLLPPIEIDGRLPLWLSIAVIVVLSAFCWAILISIVVALRALL
jgi:hypothetical protein